jgi:DNA-binding transcriptional LysR family regulator
MLGGARLSPSAGAGADARSAVNLRQLNYFLAIADEGSFSRAAENLLVAQPSLSQQIKSLERELGGELLERLATGVRLTAAGRAFMPEARAAVTHAQRAALDARSALGLQAGEIEVATVTSVAYGVLPPAFKLWHERYPGTTITLREYSHRRTLVEAVRDGIGDIAVGPRPTGWPGPVVALGWEELVVVLPTADPLANRRRRVPLTALADRDWVLFGPGHGLSELILGVCAGAGFKPRRTVQTAQVAAAAHLAEAGLGVTIVPENVVPAGLAAAVHRLQTPLVRELVAYTRQDSSPVADAFVQALRAQTWKRRPRTAAVVG